MTHFLLEAFALACVSLFIGFGIGLWAGLVAKDEGTGTIAGDEAARWAERERKGGGS